VWADNETDRDFLNFTGVAETVAEMVRQAKGPISIGVSGQWGVGKSSMIRLIRKSLEDPAAAGGHGRQVHSQFLEVFDGTKKVRKTRANVNVRK
jgi:predicted KAP-like P-loop ATPase